MQLRAGGGPGMACRRRGAKSAQRAGVARVERGCLDPPHQANPSMTMALSARDISIIGMGRSNGRVRVPPLNVSFADDVAAPHAYATPVTPLSTGTAARTPQPQSTERWALVERKRLAGGWLELVNWESGKAKRMLRIWVPDGYYAEGARGQLIAQAAPLGGWPVLYLNDAQNLFYDSMSFSGHSWRAAETATELIAEGDVPPFVIVGMDHAGPQRSLDYTPYKPGIAPGGWRKDAANWPGGGVAAYVDRVVSEVLPWAQAAYGVTSHSQRSAFGGSSFGGICTLCMAMRHPGVFSSVLVESPSLWIAEERFLRKDLATYKGRWPARMFLAMGAAEYKGDGSAVFSGMLVAYLQDLAEMLEKQGLKRGAGLLAEVVPGAAHTESAWAERLPRALRHLCGPWRAPL